MFKVSVLFARQQGIAGVERDDRGGLSERERLHNQLVDRQASFPTASELQRT